VASLRGLGVMSSRGAVVALAFREEVGGRSRGCSDGRRLSRPSSIRRAAELQRMGDERVAGGACAGRAGSGVEVGTGAVTGGACEG
jgi:hypothetical protein